MSPYSSPLFFYQIVGYFACDSPKDTRGAASSISAKPICCTIESRSAWSCSIWRFQYFPIKRRFVCHQSLPLLCHNPIDFSPDDAELICLTHLIRLILALPRAAGVIRNSNWKLCLRFVKTTLQLKAMNIIGRYWLGQEALKTKTGTIRSSGMANRNKATANFTSFTRHV